MPEVPTIPFERAAHILSGKYLPATEYDPNGPYLIHGSNSVMGRARTPNVEGPVVIFARVGSYSGAVAFSAEPAWVNNNAAAFRAKEGFETRFLYYWARWFDLGNLRQGSGQPFISNAALNAAPVLVHPLETQQAIAALLGALDDKIELNRRMNETLEAMAQAIFRDWFVDFGPVRRKMEGATDPVVIMGGLDPERSHLLAELFPSILADSGLPAGWELKRLRDICELAYGKSLPASAREHGDIPVYGSGGVTGFHNVAMVEGPGIIIGRKGTVGALYWEPRSFFPIDTVFFVRPKGAASLVYLWALLPTLGLSEMNTDAAVPGLNRDNAYRLNVAWGGGDITAAFDALVAPLRSKMDQATAENRTLTETRDYLLPRLMSGQVRVGDVLEQVSEAAA